MRAVPLKGVVPAKRGVTSQPEPLMSQLTSHPAYQWIADQLDALGQRWRLLRLLRGVMIWVIGAAGLAIALGFIAHGAGPGWISRLSGWVWLGWVLGGAGVWVARPLLLKPHPLTMARLADNRLPDMHNALTNGLLLAQREDLADNPWLPLILREAQGSAGRHYLPDAIDFAALLRLAWRLGVALVPLALAGILWPAPLAHGWSQMLRPAGFAPQVGSFQIVEVRPGDVTLVRDQPLEIVLLAKGPQTPEAMLYFDNQPAPAVLAPSAQEGMLRYSYRLDQVRSAMKYRVEVGGTQSPWFTVNVVRQVRLRELSMRIVPPTYTGQSPRDVVLKEADLQKEPLVVPQGSTLQLAALLDVPVNAAMWQFGEQPPTAAEASQENHRFIGQCVVLEDTALSLLLTDGSGQIIARLPESPLTVRVAKDGPPAIEIKWPGRDMDIGLDQELRIAAQFKDDYGITRGRVLMASATDQPMSAAGEQSWSEAGTTREFTHVLKVDQALRKHGQSLFIQVEATDNRDLSGVLKDAGPQTTQSRRIELKFRDAAQIERQQKESDDQLRAILMELLKTQRQLHAAALAWNAKDTAAMRNIGQGQAQLRDKFTSTAQTFAFDPSNRAAQKTLLLLADGAAKQAVEQAAAAAAELSEKQRPEICSQLQSRQRRVINTLEGLLALLNVANEPATRPTTRAGGDLANRREAYEKMNEALKQFIAAEQRIMEQTAGLAKKPVDDWTDADRKLMEELKQSQERMDAFMQERVADFSRNAEQDQANASLLKEMMQVYSEVTLNMKNGGLKEKPQEIAVALEENGLELAKEIQSNLEKWLMDTPDRQKWTQEDPLNKNDTPMAELPAELEDMVGELMEEQEDLFDEMEDTNANWHDSLDKGAGWDAMDGPIANMSAKGVTGNQLPNNNEMDGRSGEGRSGKSQGEMVGDTAVGKGGRNTPTRLDPTPFTQGQINDQSKDPVGGATGGGKLSGQGGAGLEGPVPPKIKAEMQRLAQKQAELRNKAERLNLQYKLGRYDNFNLKGAVGLMRRVESDLEANRYQNALRTRDVLLDNLDTARNLVGGQVRVQRDSTPTAARKMEQEARDAAGGELPPAWSEALKAYYSKLAGE